MHFYCIMAFKVKQVHLENNQNMAEVDVEGGSQNFRRWISKWFMLVCGWGGGGGVWAHTLYKILNWIVIRPIYFFLMYYLCPAPLPSEIIILHSILFCHTLINWMLGMPMLKEVGKSLVLPYKLKYWLHQCKSAQFANMSWKNSSCTVINYIVLLHLET